MNPRILLFVALFLIGFAAFGVSGASASGGPPESPLKTLARKYAKENGIPEEIVFGLIMTESSWNPDAINPLDPSFGLMQITSGVFHDYGYPLASREEMLNPEINIIVGCAYLADLISRNGLYTGIQMYNIGEAGYIKHGHRAPAYLDKIINYAKTLYGWEG